MITTVAAILANPRYTGRQVWNRQRTDHDQVDERGELFPGAGGAVLDGVGGLGDLAGGGSSAAGQRADVRPGAGGAHRAGPGRRRTAYLPAGRAGVLRDLRPAEVAKCLRANDMIVVCDHTTWAVESDTIRIELAPTTILGLVHFRRKWCDRKNRTIIAFGVEITCPRGI
jgi:hypothetical protein